MVTVSIGGMSVPLENASQGWINQMLEDARKRNIALCIRVLVQSHRASVTLSTPGCPPAGGGGRQANEAELKIFEEWKRSGLADGRIKPGELTDFLAKLRPFS